MAMDTRSDAQRWLTDVLHVSRETIALLSIYGDLVATENAKQNLVATSTLGESFWPRHIVDSAQLLLCVPPSQTVKRWIDVGSGPGLPGLVVAILAPTMHMTLVESRRRRCEFLSSAITRLGLGERVLVQQQRVESLPGAPYDIISARAFAPLDRLIPTIRHLAGPKTIWVLPKGEKAVNELSTLPPKWQTAFHVEPSITHPRASILVGHGVFPD